MKVSVLLCPDVIVAHPVVPVEVAVVIVVVDLKQVCLHGLPQIKLTYPSAE